MSAVFLWENSFCFVFRYVSQVGQLSISFNLSVHGMLRKSRDLSPFILYIIVCLIISSSNHSVLTTSAHVSLVEVGKERKLEKKGGISSVKFFSFTSSRIFPEWYCIKNLNHVLWVHKMFTKPCCPQLGNCIRHV